MSDSVTDVVTRRSAIAIAQQEADLQAVELRKQADALELIWTKSSTSPLNLLIWT